MHVLYFHSREYTESTGEGSSTSTHARPPAPTAHTPNTCDALFEYCSFCSHTPDVLWSQPLLIYNTTGRSKTNGNVSADIVKGGASCISPPLDFVYVRRLYCSVVLHVRAKESQSTTTATEAIRGAEGALTVLRHTIVVGRRPRAPSMPGRSHGHITTAQASLQKGNDMLGAAVVAILGLLYADWSRAQTPC